MKINEKYSYKSWKRQSFTGKDPNEFNDTEIRAAGFSQVEPFTKVFPDLMNGVTFRDCNLDNCVIPPGNTVIGGTNKHVKEQKDREYWIVDKDLNPIAPLFPDKFDKWGVSKDPSDLPSDYVAEQQTMPITMYKAWLQSLALKELTMDTEKLIAILKLEGKL